MRALMTAGMDVLRLNLSHLPPTDGLPPALDEALATLGGDQRTTAIMLDTRGPELRTGTFSGGSAELAGGSEFTLTTDDVTGSNSIVSISYERLPREVSPGDRILLDDGAVELRVKERSATAIICHVVEGGTVRDRRKITVPGVRLVLGPLDPADVADIELAIGMNAVDMIALSFVRRASDVLAARNLIEHLGADVMLIAKIECAESVENVRDILRVSDGLMVARGDLGVEMETEDVPLIQKRLISLCNRQGKPVITATQMLESMITNPTPTRAEASDIANAILDGTDAIMLSGETAVGRHPLKAVEFMDRIARRIERSMDHARLLRERGTEARSTVTDAISHATCSIAHALAADAIIAPTQSGHTARAIARYRPASPIVAVTTRAAVARKLSLVWGVRPLIGQPVADTDGTIDEALSVARAAGMIAEGDLAVITAGVPVGISGTTNLVRVYTLGDILVRGKGIGHEPVTGRVVVARNPVEAEAAVEGDVLVVTATDADFVEAARRVSAIIAEEGGLTSHAALIALDLGIPVIVGADGAVGRLQTGTIITVDPARGLVYRGEARV